MSDKEAIKLDLTMFTTRKFWIDILTILLVAGGFYALGHARSIKDTEMDCNRFIRDEIFTNDVRNCLGMNVPTSSPDYDFINITLPKYNLSENNEMESEIA